MRYPSKTVTERTVTVSFSIVITSLFSACDGRGSDACDDFDCSGHGECYLDEARATACRCDEGFVPQDMTCIPHDARCPIDMMAIPGLSLCIDRFEVSRGEGDIAMSVKGVIPWVDVVWDEARSVCEAAGKRLCTADEWLEACRGPEGNTYAYGDEFEPLRCNGEEYAPEHDFVARTGTMPDCEGGYPGLNDMMGNAWEWTDDCDEYLCYYRGGGFGDTDVDIDCATLGMGAPTVEYENVGFRCCKSFGE